MNVAEALYLIAPLVVAGAVHGPVIKRDLLPGLARPLDFGRSFRGERILGANKTWRGVLVMSTVSVLVVFVQLQLDGVEPFRGLGALDYGGGRWLALGLALGLAYNLAELPNSFAKRRLGIPPGGVSRRRAAVQYAVDQADLAVGATLVLGLFLGWRWEPLLVVFAVGVAVHVVVDRLFFLLGVKRRAVGAAAC